ncbi:MAG: hypothetical protein KJO64_02675 [Bacteroidia bacterium]|nr:hypothetical protein [Bacteroidia bacterium]NNC86384.1 hypothetical protein [Bacteroidia bacterium]
MTKLNKYLLATFDYELFLGKRSGLVNECLIEPTNKILSVLNPLNIQGIFFIDTAYLLQLEKHSQYTRVKNDLIALRTQLIQLVKDGHFIFPHIHPHWNSAIYNGQNNQWDLSDNHNYTISTLNEHEQELIFSDCISYLKDIVKEAGGIQIIDSYRAGGWSLQPFQVFKKHFIEHNIKNDFSVLPGVYHFSKAQTFDYSNCDKKTPYQFNDSVCEENNQGSFSEFPISITKLSKKELFRHKMTTKFHAKWKKDSSFGRGIGQAAELTDKQPKSPDGFQLSTFNEYLSMDFLSKAKLNNYLDFCINQEFVHFLSHPKLCTNHSIQTFKDLLTILTADFNVLSNYNEIKQHYIK